MTPDDDLDRWIRDLRTHLDRGDLAGLSPFDIGDGTLHITGERAIRIMLADLADLDDPMGSTARDSRVRDVRRHSLLQDFARLRELLG
jgi:hypothetical protein